MQVDPAPTVPPIRVITLAPAVAVKVPPQVLVLFDGVATSTPAGRLSVKARLLAARALGVGTVLTTPNIYVEEMLVKEFHLPENAIPACIIPVGFPDGQRFGPTTRKPAETVTYWDDWSAAADHIEEAFPDLPARAPGDWLTFARNTYRETKAGDLVHDWDDAIVKPLQWKKGGKVNLWPLFGALGRVPVLAVHGAKSNILSDDTFRRMADAMPAMARVTVDDCGHPPSLGEAHVLEAIDAHLARA